MSKAIKYFSMFTGIGGFELGIQNAFRKTLGGEQTYSQGKHEAGERLLTEARQNTSATDGRASASSTNGVDQRPLCIGYSEIDKYAINTYERRFNGHTNYGDATAINATELPDFDLLVGGFPCQSFSIAGKRKGFDDTRGTLFFDVARILAEKRPRHLVLENVKGLLSHNGGETFQTILGVLSDLGYRVEWQVLNSKDFGVPQNRERVYFIGHLRGECSGEVLPITNANRQTLTSTMYKGIDASGRTGVLERPRIRRLTPLECERLQGFPDNWTAGESDTQRYKMCGNAVTVNVVEAVMTSLLNRGCL